MTGGRLKRVRDFIGDEPFFMTYGDGVSDVDINALLEFHKKERQTCHYVGGKTREPFRRA